MSARVEILRKKGKAQKRAQLPLGERRVRAGGPEEVTTELGIGSDMV